MTKYTPGTWHRNGNVVWADSCKDRGSIAECFLETGTHIPEDQNEANARLIAAAPDLLEACKLAVKSWFSGEVSEIHMETVLRAAIAKAEEK